MRKALYFFHYLSCVRLYVVWKISLIMLSMSTDLPSEPPTETHFDIPTPSNGRYQIQGCIGVGGMAAVFKAYDASLQVDRALKVLKPEFLLGDDIRERFQTGCCDGEFETSEYRSDI